MNQQPDKFFRQKLEGLHKPAPASAWEKIAAAQHKKNNKGLWLKIAASLLLIGAATYMLLPEIAYEEQVLAVKTKPSTAESVPPAQVPPTFDSLFRSEIKEDQKEQPAKSSVQTTTLDIQQRQRADVPKEIVGMDVYDSLTVAELTTEEITVTIPEIQPDEPSVPATERITLVFTAEEVDEYLDKKSLDGATDGTRKSSTWKKFLKKANNLTNNQDPFREIRQKKNEILALNFKNVKQRDQNK